MNDTRDGMIAVALSAYAEGRVTQAEHACRQALLAFPADADLLHLLGIIQLDQGLDAKATRSLEQACGHARSAPPQAHNNLGIALRRQGRLEDAASAFREALGKRPRYVGAMYNLAVTLIELGDVLTAADLLTDIAAACPRHVAAHYALAEALIALGEEGAAARSLLHCLRVDPEDAFGATVLLASLGAIPPPSGASHAHLKELYRKKARTWDRTPGYLAHEHIREALSRHAGSPFRTTLDAGCGTGLAGALIREKTDCLTGVDLCADMLEAARAKHIYDELRKDDLLSFLTSAERRFELIVSAATLIHFGDLGPVLISARSALQSSGVLAFTTYSNDNVNASGFGMSPYPELARAGCFAHGSRYIAELAQASGYVLSEVSTIAHEHNASASIPGLLVVLHRTDRD